MENARKIPPTGVRIPESVKAALKASAKKEGRSLNSEILKRLERSLANDGVSIS